MLKNDSAESLSTEGRKVRVTQPDKPYFSKETKLSKLDLVRYYLSMRRAHSHRSAGLQYLSAGRLDLQE